MNQNDADRDNCNAICVRFVFLLGFFILHGSIALRCQPVLPVPHHFSEITRLTDGTIATSLDGSVSNMFPLSGTIASQFMQAFDLYLVDGSTNLTDWSRLAVLLRTNNNAQPLLFTDIDSTNFPQRFYRTPTNHQITLFPAPTGPYTVATAERLIIDPWRTNLYRYYPPTNAFMVTCWYPAQSSPVDMLLSPMWDARVAADFSFYSFIVADPRWARINSAARGHRFNNLPAAVGSARWPVVIYSHGLPVFRKSASHQAEELASHGYIVLAADHSDCWATEFPNGEYLTGNHNGDVSSRLKDIQFLLDELAVLDATDPIMAGRLDLGRVGLFGFSYGGEVAQSSRLDSRIKCVAIYDGVNTQPLGAGLQVPLLCMLGQTNGNYSEDFQLFTRAATNAVFLQISGADHPTCLDYAWWGEIPWGRTPALAIDSCLVWFFDTYLKRENHVFPTNSEIYNIQIK